MVFQSQVVKFILILLTIFLASCSAVRFFKADPAQDYGFLPKAKWLKEMFDIRPFNASWVTKNKKLYSTAKTRNKKIYIAPIELSYVKKAIVSGNASERSKATRIEEAEVAAGYFQERINMALADYDKFPFAVVDKPGVDTFELHLALVELQPTNPAINALGTAAGFFVPGGGLIKTVAKGEVAIEGYIKDSETGKLLEQFKDREIDKAAPFSVKDFQEYAHVRASMDDWADQFAMILAEPVDAKIEDSLPFSLSPF